MAGLPNGSTGSGGSNRMSAKPCTSDKTLAGAGALGATLTQLLDITGVGVIQLDARRRIVAANDRALSVLQAGDALRDKSGFLFAKAQTDDEALQAALARALPPFGDPGEGGSLTIKRSAPMPPLVLHVNPLPGREASFRGWPAAALVLLAEPARGARIDPDLAAAVLGLTPTESRVAVMLAEGMDVREIRRRDGTQGMHDPLPRQANLRQARTQAPGGTRAAGSVAGRGRHARPLAGYKARVRRRIESNWLRPCRKTVVFSSGKVLLCRDRRRIRMKPQVWNPDEYARNARYVSDLGMPALELLNPRPGERILDLGCGDGELTRVLRERGSEPVGIDSSRELIAAARTLGLDVHEQDACEMEFENEFDAVFSNAVLHWISETDIVIGNVHRALRRGGRFVGEFGGYGNCAAIVTALVEELELRGIDGSNASPWHFPTADEFSNRLAAAGFSVPYIELIPRPTLLPAGMQGFLATFADSFSAHVALDQRNGYLSAVCDRLKPLLRRNGEWIADYVRLRFEAIKE